jgi:VIT1/CCC1 family predicted Fe2+/Mn2+ transporter
MERVHRLIKEEKYEIDHNRDQEKEELLELYKAKGFKDKQLEEVVEVLMADDNRLLQIMLEEELGLTMGSFEHPLKQCLGAGLGVITGALLALLGLYFGGFVGLIISSCFALTFTSAIAAKHLNNDLTKHIIWNFSSAFLSLGCLYFLMQCFTNYLPKA